MQKPLLIFDFDGTIADTKNLIIEIGNIYASEIGEGPLSQEDINIYRDKGALSLMAKRNFSIFKVMKLLKRGSEIFAEKSESVKLVPGIVQAISNITDEGIEVAIVTSNTEESVRKIAGSLSEKIAGIFPEKDIFGKAAKLKKVVKEFGVNPKDVFYVGDEPRDMAAAIKAGIHPVGVTWGFGSKESLVSAGAEIIINSPEELNRLYSA